MSGGVDSSVAGLLLQRQLMRTTKTLNVKNFRVRIPSNNGVSNIKGGCYAKCIDLAQEKEPEIWNAIKFGTDSMEAVKRALFTGAGAAELFNALGSNERQAWQLHQSCLGRCSRRSIQLVPRQVTKSAGVCLPRSGHLNVSRLNKNVRSCNRLTNAFLGGSSGSLASFVTQGPRGRNRCSVICAGLVAGSGTADESREADHSSPLLKIVVPAQDIGFSTGTRTVTITYGTVVAHVQIHNISMFVLVGPLVYELKI